MASDGGVSSDPFALVAEGMTSDAASTLRYTTASSNEEDARIEESFLEALELSKNLLYQSSSDSRVAQGCVPLKL